METLIVFNSVLLASKNTSQKEMNLAECGVCDGLTIYFAVIACELLNMDKKIYWENLKMTIYDLNMII